MINYVPQHVAWINALSHVFRWSHQIEHPRPFLGQATNNWGKFQGHFKLWIYWQWTCWNPYIHIVPVHQRLVAPSVSVATRPVLDVSVAERDLGRTAAGASQGLSWHGVDLVGCETSHWGWNGSMATRITKLCRLDSVGFSSMGISGS